MQICDREECIDFKTQGSVLLGSAQREEPGAPLTFGQIMTCDPVWSLSYLIQDQLAKTSPADQLKKTFFLK